MFMDPTFSMLQLDFPTAEELITYSMTLKAGTPGTYNMKAGSHSVLSTNTSPNASRTTSSTIHGSNASSDDKLRLTAEQGSKYLDEWHSRQITQE
jgi:hypothetical protein